MNARQFKRLPNGVLHRMIPVDEVRFIRHQEWLNTAEGREYRAANKRAEQCLSPFTSPDWERIYNIVGREISPKEWDIIKYRAFEKRIKTTLVMAVDLTVMYRTKLGCYEVDGVDKFIEDVVHLVVYRNPDKYRQLLCTCY